MLKPLDLAMQMRLYLGIGQGDCLAAHVAAESCELSNLRAAEMLRA